MSLPATINHPNGFLHAPAAGFDGVFDWSWTQGCFGHGRITPMDFDGVVERNGNFILFETKNLGVPIPKGQMYTLEAAHRLGCFTIMLIHGKRSPEQIEVWFPPAVGGKKESYQGVEIAKRIVTRWYQYADKTKQNKVDVSILNKRIFLLDGENAALTDRLSRASELARQLLELLAGPA